MWGLPIRTNHTSEESEYYKLNENCDDRMKSSNNSSYPVHMRYHNFQNGINYSPFGPNMSYFGPNMSYFGPNMSYFGPNMSYFGPNMFSNPTTPQYIFPYPEGYVQKLYPTMNLDGMTRTDDLNSKRQIELDNNNMEPFRKKSKNKKRK